MKTFQVVISNRDNLTIEVAEDQAIIDAVEAAGHLLPIACRYGGCITCAAKLIEGRVRQPNATAINSRQSKAGYILLCVARPKSDLVLEVGVESHDQLYTNPFANAANKNKLSPTAKKTD
ncbi:MAG: 2Fe-2S iron-sulfur cluster-binding protein [Granulosicoccus sp.]